MTLIDKAATLVDTTFSAMSHVFVRRRRPPILRKYKNSRRNLKVILRILAIAAVVFFCFIYGAAFGLFAPFLLSMFAIPIVVFGLIVVWALPNTLTAPVGTLECLFYAFFVSLVAWPDYLAIAIPGLPWITLLRLTCFPLVVVLLVCVSVSEDFRRKTWQAVEFGTAHMAAARHLRGDSVPLDLTVCRQGHLD